MSEGSSPKRARLELEDSIKDDHHDKYKNRDQDDQGSYSNLRKRRGDTDDDDLKDCDDIKSKNVDAARREHTLVMRLTNKEQELQECMNQIQEMKQAQTQNTAQLRSMLLDPAINLVFQRMSKEMEEHKEKLKQKQNELNAWKFTPDSQTGMRLMGKCRMLLQENGELGKMISSGRTAKLEGEISLHKALVAEMKKNQKELDEFVGELEEDVEGMQGMIFMLQQQLKEAREQISRLQHENEQLRTLQLPTEPDPGGVDKNGLDTGEKISHSSSSSESINFVYSPANHLETKPTTSSSPHSSNTLIPPLSNSSDLTVTASSTDDFSPSAFSLKVTPDSGVQTQEEDTDTLSIEDSHSSQLEMETHTTAKTLPDNRLEDDVEKTTSSPSETDADNGDFVRTSAALVDDNNVISTTNCSVHKRTSPTTAIFPNINGDIPVTAIEDCVSSVDDGIDSRTHLSEEVDVHCKTRTAEDKIDSKLTHSNSEDDLGLKQEDSVKIDLLKSNLTNGSGDNVNSSMDTE